MKEMKVESTESVVGSETELEEVVNGLKMDWEELSLFQTVDIAESLTVGPGAERFLGGVLLANCCWAVWSVADEKLWLLPIHSVNSLTGGFADHALPYTPSPNLGKD